MLENENNDNIVPSGGIPIPNAGYPSAPLFIGENFNNHEEYAFSGLNDWGASRGPPEQVQTFNTNYNNWPSVNTDAYEDITDTEEVCFISTCKTSTSSSNINILP